MLRARSRPRAEVDIAPERPLVHFTDGIPAAAGTPAAALAIMMAAHQARTVLLCRFSRLARSPHNPLPDLGSHGSLYSHEVQQPHRSEGHIQRS